MKKIFVIIVLVGGLFLTANQNVISWVQSSLSSDPKPYHQQRVKFFENLSREYYGVTDYANELELVNRSYVIADVSTDSIGLIIPSLEAITRLKQRQSFCAYEDQAGMTVVTGKQPSVNHLSEL